jgi:DNA polymerase V
MEAMDRINRTMGRGTLVPASTRAAQGWQMRQDSRSPCYTTSLKDIPIVKA